MTSQDQPTTTTTVAKLKKGQFFKRLRKGVPTEKVYTRDTYCRETKKYDCTDHDDVWGNGIQLKGSTVVAIGFTY